MSDFIGENGVVEQNISTFKVIHYFKVLRFGSSQHLANGNELWQKLHCSFPCERVEEFKYHRNNFVGPVVLELCCKEG